MELELDQKINHAIMPSCLRLSLKSKWFEMTKAGIKTEDYRDITPYWIKRLTEYKNYQGFNIEEILEFLKNGKQVDFKNTHNWLPDFCFPKSFQRNVITLGYPKSTDTERILKLEHKGIEIRTGNTEWGAEPNKLYFVIMHGAVLAPELAVIDRAIKDYSKIAKQKKVSLTTLKNRDMELGLCHYFADHDFYLVWSKIPNRPKFKKISSYGWIYPQYCYNPYKKLDVKEIGIKERLEFLLEHREVLPKYLKPV